MATGFAPDELRKSRIGKNAVHRLDRLFRQSVVGQLAGGVCQRCCPPISCGVSDFRDADFGFWVEPDGSGWLPVSGFS